MTPKKISPLPLQPIHKHTDNCWTENLECAKAEVLKLRGERLEWRAREVELQNTITNLQRQLRDIGGGLDKADQTATRILKMLSNHQIPQDLLAKINT